MQTSPWAGATATPTNRSSRDPCCCKPTWLSFQALQSQVLSTCKNPRWGHLSVPQADSHLWECSIPGSLGKPPLHQTWVSCLRIASASDRLHGALFSVTLSVTPGSPTPLSEGFLSHSRLVSRTYTPAAETDDCSQMTSSQSGLALNPLHHTETMLHCSAPRQLGWAAPEAGRLRARQATTPPCPAGLRRRGGPRWRACRLSGCWVPGDPEIGKPRRVPRTHSAARRQLAITPSRHRGGNRQRSPNPTVKGCIQRRRSCRVARFHHQSLRNANPLVQKPSASIRARSPH